MTDSLDLPHLETWVGKTRSVQDVITPRLASSLAAILDEPVDFAEGDVAPVGIQWCLCPDIAPMSGLGPDGHPARGGFLPPVPLPRRMWAGGRLRFHEPFRVGQLIERRSTIRSVEAKQGRSGSLCFVTVAHDYSVAGSLLLEEEQDIVYREITPAVAPPPPEKTPPADRAVAIATSPVLLARYSAVTFNGHRIHYDRDYTRDQEHYPGLLVHGPLQATWLLRLARQEFGTLPATFEFRGRSPLHDGQIAAAHARRDGADAVALWITSGNEAERIITFDAKASRAQE